jgi:hypothetical protein
VRADSYTLAVEQMQLGNHAFAHYADDDARWEVPAAFACQGLARGEKVIVMMDPACASPLPTSRGCGCASVTPPGVGPRARLRRHRGLPGPGPISDGN